MSKSIAQPKILLTYPTFIEVIPIIQAIIIWMRSLNFGLKKKKSSIKLTKVIKKPKNQIKYSFELCGVKIKLIIKSKKIKITHILWGIGSRTCQYFFGLSKIFNFIKSFFVNKITKKDKIIEERNVKMSSKIIIFFISIFVSVIIFSYNQIILSLFIIK